MFVVSVVARPGALAPRSFAPLDGGTPAARRRSVAVGGVRSVKWKVRSGRTVIRAGMGVPGVYAAVRALNSWRGEIVLAMAEGDGERKVGWGDVLCKSPWISLLWNPVLDRLAVKGKLDRRRQ